ncbi:hypothetical protein D7D52_34910 [Nocardia yunnanensis]|uniref:Uncharacterized protein n=1 Tax=Nocardia yunnanensis TaxID=2382165 RepID=A0A386ZLJ7_9NOCA|nr:hypothetical protein [Nocardia yunnanensis]AYF78163.1 hypothetical protein D7D52_34910 [Nocardia yunnanensis]
MPQDSRALTRAARRRAKHTGRSYQQAREDAQIIHKIMESDELSWEEAQEIYDDPRNQLLCGKCGWTVGMVCPECPGCGCYNGRCSGWRHHEYAMDDGEPEEICGECGATDDYQCNCYE